MAVADHTDWFLRGSPASGHHVGVEYESGDRGLGRFSILGLGRRWSVVCDGNRPLRSKFADRIPTSAGRMATHSAALLSSNLECPLPCSTA